VSRTRSWSVEPFEPLAACLPSPSNGIDVASGVDLVRTARTVLFLARLHPRKNVLLFAEAARRLILSGSSASFQVIGPDEGDLAPLNTFIEQHGLQERLRYGGAVPSDEAQAHLRDAAVFVLPSRGEVVPMTVLEALAVGTPVVLSSDCGLAPELQEAGAAVVIDPEPELLARAIGGLLTDEARRSALAARGLEYARQSLSIRSVVDRLEEIYAAADGVHLP
jgi:glycosyltransferase involved in cell wall biosynthesis